jgi:hypothetical protein
MSFEDRQRDAMTDFTRSSYSPEDRYVIVYRDGWVGADYIEKIASDSVLEQDMTRLKPQHRPAYRLRIRSKSNVQKAQIARLDASRAYREVTGRDAFAGAETYTRRNAEDIHD